MNDTIAVQLRRGRSYADLMRDYRIAVLAEAMAQTNYRQSEAAELLGVHKNTFCRWVNALRREVGLGPRRIK